MRTPRKSKYVKQVTLPFSVKRVDGTYRLLKDGVEVKTLIAQSEDGADREAASYIKKI